MLSRIINASLPRTLCSLIKKHRLALRVQLSSLAPFMHYPSDICSTHSTFIQPRLDRSLMIVDKGLRKHGVYSAVCTPLRSRWPETRYRLVNVRSRSRRLAWHKKSTCHTTTHIEAASWETLRSRPPLCGALSLSGCHSGYSLRWYPLWDRQGRHERWRGRVSVPGY